MQTYPTSEADFQNFELPAEDILEGNPRTEVAVHYQKPDGSVMVGVSRFTEGKYRYRQTADEINYVTAGKMIITSDRRPPARSTRWAHTRKCPGRHEVTVVSGPHGVAAEAA
ncbi:hypothetical protein [Dactylosporangium salmoneum]